MRTMPSFPPPRTAPLWCLGQRVFFLHDGRTSDLVQALNAHRSRRSETSHVIDSYNGLRDDDQQDLPNFLRLL